MRKTLAALLLIIMVSGASATTIESETLNLDLERSEASAEIAVEELTSSSFTYITSADVESVSASSQGRNLSCEAETLALGDEIVCDTDLRKNFTVNIEYSFSGLVENQGANKIFRYSHPIYRPTNNFNLIVELPEGSVKAENRQDAITPDDGRERTDGRTIFVEWNKSPQTGDTLNFQIKYETLEPSTDYMEILGFILVLIALSGMAYGAYIYSKKSNRENVRKSFSDLSDDEKDIIELLIDNEGEMLQKDIVDLSNYSKAKISGLVSQLEDKKLVVKEKEGRSNKLRISDKYNY